jgi:Tfp pilus assembly protein PilN
VNQKLNLASKAFSNRILPWTLATLVLVASIISLVFIAGLTREANIKSTALQNEINALNQQDRELRQQAQNVKESLTVEQYQTLKAAHELVDRKRFSWSRLFSDLEAALPGKVRVSRISVRDVAVQGSQTVAELDLAVFAKSASTVTDMIAEMDRSGIFKADLRSQNLQKGRGEEGAEYELTVIYRPRASATTSEGTNLASVEHAGNGLSGGSK